MRCRVLYAALHKYDQKVSSGSVINPKQVEKLEWYKAYGKFDSVMFVKATPQSQLNKEVEKVVRREKVKIRVVE